MPVLRIRAMNGVIFGSICSLQRLAAADRLDIVEHQQGRGRGIKGHADRLGQRRHLQGHRRFAGWRVRLCLSHAAQKRKRKPLVKSTVGKRVILAPFSSCTAEKDTCE